jgi:hypothetical protein
VRSPDGIDGSRVGVFSLGKHLECFCKGSVL